MLREEAREEELEQYFGKWSKFREVSVLEPSFPGGVSDDLLNTISVEGVTGEADGVNHYALPGPDTTQLRTPGELKVK